MANIALLGHGVVGSGTRKILINKKEELHLETGENLNLKYIFVRHDYDVPYKNIFTYDIDTILSDEEIDIVVEVMGGVDPAYKYVKKALQNNKSVVTSNKQLVVEHGWELNEIAFKNNVNFMFEGSVAGAVPIIHSVRNTLIANEVKSLWGIINGTTNFILTKMLKENVNFNSALKEAQNLGYAEADPSSDIDGIDTSRKICILASLCYGKHVYPFNMYAEGIRNIRLEDMKILSGIGRSIKLLGVAKPLDNGKLFLGAAPFVVEKDSMLSVVDDSFNAVEIDTDCAGALLFYGRGAGSLQTASAVVNDICECAKAVSCLYAPWNDENPGQVADFKNVRGKFYINIEKDENKDKILKLFGKTDILFEDENEIAFSIENITQENAEQLCENAKVNAIIRYKQ